MLRALRQNMVRVEAQRPLMVRFRDEKLNDFRAGPTANALRMVFGNGKRIHLRLPLQVCGS